MEQHYLTGTSCASLYAGDCLDLLPTKVPAQSVDLVLCDLPYATTDCEGDVMIPPVPLWEQYRRVLAPGGCVVLFASMPFTAILATSNLPWLKYALVWNKNKCGSPGLAKIRPMKTHEDILIFAPGKTTYNPQMEEGTPYARRSKRLEGYEGKHNTHGYGLKPQTEFSNDGTRYPKSIINIGRDFSAQQQVHPHQKPVSLLEWLILTYSHPGALVLDNSMGSGSTGVAALQTGRNFIGMEKYPEPYSTAITRLAAVTC